MDAKTILACEICPLSVNGRLCLAVTEAIIGAAVRANPTTDISGVIPRSETARNLLTGFASEMVAKEAGETACAEVIRMTAN